MDGNTAAAHIAYYFSEVVALYPITPSSPMGEAVDQWASEDRKNVFGRPVEIAEMQSEAGAAGAVHGALSAGAFCSTFTASQGLLLMIPNMYKIAGELMPSVFHVAARAIAGQALSIFGDHQDVMAARSTGFCHLCSGSIQEVMDLALVAHLSSIRASLPFVHFFDGFRTSHEVQKIEMIDYDEINPLIDYEAMEKHRMRALNPEHPHLRGSAQNPDIYFQINEAANPYYLAAPQIVEEEMDKVYRLTGRRYHAFDYVGHPEAERVIVAMGSSTQTIEETVNYLNQKNEKVGLVKVRLYRPFSKELLRMAVPESAKKIAVLDRTKESGSFGEPLYLDICATLDEDRIIVGGRYGLGSKEFNPSHVKAVFDNLSLEEPKNHFTVGIEDDVTYFSLPLQEKIISENPSTVRCMFWGLGGDGTVGANKDAIKIIGDNTDKFVQGYFAYDSKKSGGLTISHLRFGDEPIHSTYLIQEADYLACHNSSYIWKYDMLKYLRQRGIFVLNCSWSEKELEKNLPAFLKKEIADKEAEFYIIDAVKIAKEVGLGGRINMIMQAVFFDLAKIIPVEKALQLLKESIENLYRKKSEKIVQMNQKAVDQALDHLQKITYSPDWKKLLPEKKSPDMGKPAFIREVADVINQQEGDMLPVSVFTPGGVFPSATTKYEKRDIAINLPKWKPENCIQCNQCAFICPHAAIRPVLMTEEEKQKAPKDMQIIKPIGKDLDKYYYGIIVSPLDCTGCGNCIAVCPGKQNNKALEFHPKEEIKQQELQEWDYANTLPSRSVNMNKFTIKGSQFQKPLLEFSGACAGCGETPYVKLITQLFGERMIVSNATGCSSIWGGSAPSVPWTTTQRGYGPAWANSLFEDNAEYGFGMYLAVHFRRGELASWVEKALKEKNSDELNNLLSEWLKEKDNGEKAFALSDQIKTILQKMKRTPVLEEIWKRRDLLSKPSIWIIGGDGWAYDIGYGGLDHVLAMDKDVNILVMDTEVYSNTGGQASKATPLGAIAKFAAAGKRTMKKDLGLMAMSYGNVYVASVSIGANPQQYVKAVQEAESFPGPSIIIGYATCVAHGVEGGMMEYKKADKQAVASGYWTCYRYDPRLEKEGKNAFQLDSADPSLDLQEFLFSQVRYRYLEKTHPEEAKKMHERLRRHLEKKHVFYKALSEGKISFSS